MAYNGSGTFTPYTPGNPVVTGTSISSTAFNNTITDLANGLSNAVTRDGQSPATSNLPMGGNKLTGLGAGTVAGDSVRFEQIALSSLGAAASGANSDITSLTGLTTALTVAQGGTGATTAAAARSALGAAASGANGDITSLTALTAGGLPDNSVLTADIAALQVTGAKIADATITTDKLAQPLTIGTAQNTTSGTSIDFTGIPSWVKRITFSLKDVSTNGTSLWQMQLGTSGGVVTTGYSSGSGTSTSTTGLLAINSIAASDNMHGHVVLTLEDASNTWVMSSNILRPSSGVMQGAGYITLASALTTMRFTTLNGTDTFDAGSVNILYEG